MSVEIGGRTVRLRPYLRHYEARGAGIFLVSEHQRCLLRDPRRRVRDISKTGTEQEIKDLLCDLTSTFHGACSKNSIFRYQAGTGRIKGLITSLIRPNNSLISLQWPLAHKYYRAETSW